jgi:hypothetical protein
MAFLSLCIVSCQIHSSHSAVCNVPRVYYLSIYTHSQPAQPARVYTNTFIYVHTNFYTNISARHKSQITHCLHSHCAPRPACVLVGVNKKKMFRLWKRIIGGGGGTSLWKEDQQQTSLFSRRCARWKSRIEQSCRSNKFWVHGAASLLWFWKSGAK